jgi:hypothetical protein
MDQLNELYEDFHVVTVPYMDRDLKGVEALQEFSYILV